MTQPYLEEARTGEHAFWRYLLTLFIIVVFALIVQTVTLLGAYILEGTLDLEQYPPVLTLFVAVSAFAAALVGLWLGVRLLHRRSMHSLVAPGRKIQWRWLLLSGLVWFALSAAADLIVSQFQPGNYVWSFDARQFLPYALAALLLIPIQTSTEELIFRGYLTQGFGRLGGFWLAWLLPSLMFGLLHGANPEVGTYGFWLTMPFYIGFGLLLGWVTLKTGGLELALGLHVANNLYASMAVTFPSSALPSPALFYVQRYDAVLALVVFFILALLYLLIMFVIKRGAGKAALTGLLALMLLAGCSSPAASPDPQSQFPLGDCRLWTPGMRVEIDAECGQLEVPENPDDPNGRQISLSIAVIPASSRTPDADPLFLIPGGPGQGAVETYAQLVGAIRNINVRRDLVLVDLRGTGASNPLICPTSVAEEPLEFGVDTPLEEQLAEIETCQQSLDADTHFYTTELIAGDLDRVRQELGYEQVNLLGVSYGTRVALTYARLYPERTRTLVLDSVAPLGWALGSSTDKDARAALNGIFARCEADTECAQAFPDVAGQFQALVEQLSAEPVDVQVADPRTAEMVTVHLDGLQVFSTLRLMAYSTEFASLIPLIVHTANTNGDLQPLAAQLVTLNSSLSDSIADGMYLSVLCAEDVPFLPTGTPPPGDLLSASNDDLRAICAQWPHGEPNQAAEMSVSMRVPALLLSGEYDPVTPPENAAAAAVAMENGLQLVVPGSGHNVFYRGCLPRVIRDFIESGSVQGLDTTCVEEIRPQPFFISPVNPQP